jgi:hypothetical protein
MKATDYDVKQFIRILYHTRLFESAVASQEAEMGGNYDFRGPLLRRMTAEELNDSFLVMEFGNRDDSTNKALKSRWEAYANSVKNLFKMPLPQVVALNKAADAAEKKVYADRAEARKIRIQVNKARAEGNTELAKELSQKARAVYKKIRTVENKEDNMMVSMVMQRNLRTKSRPFMRASEQGSPAKPGTFMRQFGASDRMSPDASNTGASIPQALTLLNGNEVAKLTDGKGTLARALRDAPSPGDRLDTLFLSIYGATPTTAEKQQYLTLIKNPTQLTILARAMMNSKRFLFVQ